MIALTSSQVIISEPVYEQSTDITISLPCTIQGDYCSANATCKTTIINPEAIVIINDESMVQNGAVFEIDLNSTQTSINGEYQFNVVCSDQGFSNSRFLIFHITPNGELMTEGKSMMYIALLVIFVMLFVLCIYGGYRFEMLPLKYALFLCAYILFIGVTFIAWNLSLDYLTSSPFLTSFFRIVWIVSMVGFFPLLLVMSFFTVWMMMQMNEIQNMIDKGIPSNEAYERVVKKGFKSFKKVKW